MKKQFFRVKQLADQTFSRAGKTDVLSDDLQEADRKVEYIKNSCQNVTKKLSTCLVSGQLQGESGTKEKLLKKSPGFQLGTAMIESGSTCDDDSLMKVILNKCGYAEKNLSEEFVEHDFRVEQHVLLPLQNILEVDIPNINKQKRNVTKMCLDMDSAKTRYQQIQKHVSNNNAGAAKIESIKDELKDSEQKVEQSRDVLACEMFHLAAKESDLCYTILQYYKFQKHCHEYALRILNKLIPELENEICSSKVKPVYGEDLEKHLTVTGRKIAFPIELCVCALLELGVEEEGLFRLAGAASKVKRMKLSFDAGCMTLETALSYRDPHVIAGALKSYLRELPEPLLTHDLYDEWLNAAKAQTHPDNKLQALWMVVHKLPKANFDNLSYLIKFFHILSKNHEINKMSPHNIAIVIAPSLIWTKDENKGSGFGLNVNVSLYPSIIDLLVTYADWFFDKDMDFYVTLEPIMNGEFEEKATDKGIDNKGFDMKMTDKMHKSAIEKVSGQNHGAGDIDANTEEIKRSQSVNSLSEEVQSYESPKPITRRKNKSVAPCPPIFREEKKKEEIKIIKDSFQPGKLKDPNLITDKPDKPPRPNVCLNSTLPRPAKSNRESKSIDLNQDNVKVYCIKSSSNLHNEDMNKQSSHIIKEKIIKTMTTTSTNTETQSKDSCLIESLNNKKLRPLAAPRSGNLGMGSVEKPTTEQESKPTDYCKVNLISVKKEWLLGKDNDTDISTLKKPAVPERPLSLKSQSIKSRSSIDVVNLRNNYENISVLAKDSQNDKNSNDLNLQNPQTFSIDKQKISLITGNDQAKNKLEDSLDVFFDSLEKDEKDLSEKNSEKNYKNNKDSDNSDIDCKNVVIPIEEKKTSTLLTFSGQMDKPERPPKPDHKLPQPSSHSRALSDGQIIDMKPGEKYSDNVINNNNSDSSHCIKFVVNNNVASEVSTSSSPPTSFAPIKHPQSSPPPPPIPAKPRANSQSESTDF